MASAPVLEEQRLNQKWNRIRTSPVKLLFLSTFLINVVETKLNLYQVSISAPSCSLFLLVERIKYNLSVCIINFPSWGGELKKGLSDGCRPILTSGRFLVFFILPFCLLWKPNENKKNICISPYLHEAVGRADIIPENTAAFCYPARHLHFRPQTSRLVQKIKNPRPSEVLRRVCVCVECFLTFLKFLPRQTLCITTSGNSTMR